MEFVQNSHGPLIVIKLKRYKFVYKFWSEKKPALAGKYICLQVKEQIRKLVFKWRTNAFDTEKKKHNIIIKTNVERNKIE